MFPSLIDVYFFSCCSDISSEEVLRLTTGSELENLQGRSMHRKGRGKSSRSKKSNAGPSSDSHLSPCPDTVLLDTSNRDEIRESRVNDGNSKRKPRSQKKRSGYVSLVH